MGVVQRLMEYVDFKGLSINQFSKEIDVSNSYFSKQKASDGSIGSKILQEIVKKYEDISLEWLITGKGSMLRGTEVITQVSTCPELLAENEELKKNIALLERKIEQKERNIDTLTWCLEEMRKKNRSKNMADNEEILDEQKSSN